jgi:hypothetical protein
MMILNRKEGYFGRRYEQLVNWMSGTSIHNKIDDECCPDFTCCTNLLPDEDDAKKILWDYFMEENLEQVREYKITQIFDENYQK